jgi:opacity protein-like surface antigen
LEAELGYTSYENNALYPFANSSNFPNLNGQKFSRTSGGDVSRFTGTLNGFYDFTNLSSLFAPYIGAGVGGAADRRSSGLYTAANGTVFTSAASSSPQGIGLLEGGLAIKLTGNLSIVPAYRYIQYFRSNQGSANIVKIGLRYQF